MNSPFKELSATQSKLFRCLVGRELRWIQEDRHDDLVRPLERRIHELQMALVQVAHGGDEGHPAVAQAATPGGELLDGGKAHRPHKPFSRNGREGQADLELWPVSSDEHILV